MKRIVTVQDISCFGKCSITVALPVISAMGIECCIVPTSLLSTHTGGFSGYTFKDLSSEIMPIAEHWRSIDLHFDAIYTGYLGSREQVDLIKKFISLTKSEDTRIFVDPAMADNGRLYTGFEADFPKKMMELCLLADVIAPNVTEASMLLGVPYLSAGEYDSDYIYSLIEGFVEKGIKTVIITGVKYADGRHGAVGYSADEKRFVSCFAEDIPCHFHGTGDTFSSVLFGAMTRGADTELAIRMAIDFTVDCIKSTLPELVSHSYGVRFESCLPRLCEASRALEEAEK